MNEEKPDYNIPLELPNIKITIKWGREKVLEKNLNTFTKQELEFTRHCINQVLGYRRAANQYLNTLKDLVSDDQYTKDYINEKWRKK